MGWLVPFPTAPLPHSETYLEPRPGLARRHRPRQQRGPREASWARLSNVQGAVRHLVATKYRRGTITFKQIFAFTQRHLEGDTWHLSPMSSSPTASVGLELSRICDQLYQLTTTSICTFGAHARQESCLVTLVWGRRTHPGRLFWQRLLGGASHVHFTLSLSLSFDRISLQRWKRNLPLPVNAGGTGSETTR